MLMVERISLQVVPSSIVKVLDKSFGKEITGDENFYLKLITLMKDEPLKRMDKYQHDWDATVNKFTKEFIEDFCLTDGHIDWEKLTKFVSASEPLNLPKRKRN